MPKEDDIDEALRRLIDNEGDSTRPHEPTLAERQRASRQADLARRLAEEANHRRSFEKRREQHHRSQKHKRWFKRAAGLTTFLALAVAYSYFTHGYGLATGNAPPGIGTPLVQPRPPNFPPIDKSASPSPLGTPPPPPSVTGKYNFMQTHEDQSPVTWDPCRPIRFTINSEGQAPGGEDLIRQAAARAAEATGLQIIEIDPTKEQWTKDRKLFQPDRYGKKWAPVLVSWSSPDETPKLAGPTAGFGGPVAISLHGDDDKTYVSGSIVLDAPQLDEMIRSGMGPAYIRSVIQHEWGHLLGLEHVEDQTELMNPVGSPLVPDWGIGDLHGLHALGSGKCNPDL